MAVLNRDFNVPSGIIVGAHRDNFVHVQGSDTGNSVSIVADGIDTNISITLIPKGNGTVNIPSAGMTFPSGTNNGVLYLDSSGSISTSPNFTFTGMNVLTNGTMTADAFIPTSSTVPTNGLYLKDVNTIGFATNSTGAMYINPTGKVGIGGIATSFIFETTNDVSLHSVRVGLGNNSIASNTVVGNLALNSNTSGSQNSALGQNALKNNTTGSQNTGLGVSALYTNSTGSGNTGLGYNSLFSNLNGSNNTAVGINALLSNTAGNSNSAFGSSALYSNSTGNNNVAFGPSALYSNASGSSNTAAGNSALYSNTTGDNNTSFGSSALYNNTTGTNNAAYGNNALFGNTTGSNNTAFGYSAGYSGGQTNQTGSRNTFLGYQTSATVDGLFNSTAIGNSAQITESNQIVLGNNAITTTLLNGSVLISTTNNPNNSKLVVNGQIETTSGIRFPDGSILTSATPGVLTTTSITQITQTIVESFSSSVYRSAKYFVQITNSTRFHIIELLLVHDNSTVYLSQYGEIYTASSLGTFDATITAGKVNLLFTPTYALTTVKVLRQSLSL